MFDICRKCVLWCKNIPALKTLQFCSVADYHSRLQRLGFTQLLSNADHYGEGLALGSAEVSLLSLVTAYAALAHRGWYRELAVTQGHPPSASADHVQRGRNLDRSASTGRTSAGHTLAGRTFSPEVASLIGHGIAAIAARKRSNIDGKFFERYARSSSEHP